MKVFGGADVQIEFGRNGRSGAALTHGAADEEKPAIARWDCMHSMSCLE